MLKIKRGFAIILITILMATTLAGCGKTQQDTVTLTKEEYNKLAVTYSYILIYSQHTGKTQEDRAAAAAELAEVQASVATDDAVASVAEALAVSRTMSPGDKAQEFIGNTIDKAAEGLEAAKDGISHLWDILVTGGEEDDKK